MARTAKVPPEYEALFAEAERHIRDFFQNRQDDPTRGTIQISGERFLLVRAAALSVDFFEVIKRIFTHEGEQMASSIASQVLFDIAHALGQSDARHFHKSLGLNDRIAKLSAGPIFFAYSGWAFVDISAESRPEPNENYYLLYDHPYSFEADAWISSGRRSDFPVCVMNAGYSSGWCEESFGVTLVATEIQCRAKGDQHCRFIMAPPDRIQEHVSRYIGVTVEPAAKAPSVEISQIFRRDWAQEALRESERRFRSIAESAPVGLGIYDSTGNLAYANDKFMEILGHRPRLLGRPGDRNKSASSGENSHEPLAALWDEDVPRLRSGEIKRAPLRSFRVACGDGVIRDLEVNTSLVGDGICLVLNDATERKQAEKRLVDSELQLRTLLEATGDGVLVVDAETKKFVLANRAICDMLGYRREELTVLGVDDIHPQDALAAANRHFRAIMEQELPRAIEDLPVKRKDGSVFLADITGTTMTLAERTYVIGIFRDLTERHQARQRLQESEERFRTIFSSVDNGIIVHDAATGAFLEVNQRVCDLFGVRREEALELDLGGLIAGIPPYTAERLAPLLKRALAGEPLVFEWLCAVKDGRRLWLEISLRRAAFGGREAVLSAIRDISERKHAEERIQKLVRSDALTGLVNRRVFVDAVQQAITRARRSGTSFAVLYLDLDHFKDVNDTLGHPVGDALLQGIAVRLNDVVRATDTVARFGGDEFAVLAADIGDPTDAGILAVKLLEAVGQRFPIDGNVLRTGTSIGIALYGPDTPDAETLLAHADVALYRAKSEGRGAYRFFTEAMDVEVRERVRLNSELQQAIDAGQLFLLYQPQVDIYTGRILGLEALVRWQHPRRGVVEPSEFILAAEKSGLIVALGDWVLRATCRQLRLWIDDGITPPMTAANLSAAQFKSPLELERSIAAILSETGIAPTNLELELTETALMEASREHDDLLRRLQDSGIKLAIDDFGTGYSSLDYLRRFRVNRIKIAQNFVTNVTTDVGSAAIVKAAIGLARDLGLSVIAEGVETNEQVALLKTWGCREAQGYYFAKPLLPEDVAPLLRKGTIT